MIWKLNKDVQGFAKGTEVTPISGSCGSYTVQPAGHTRLIRVHRNDLEEHNEQQQAKVAQHVLAKGHEQEQA